MSTSVVWSTFSAFFVSSEDHRVNRRLYATLMAFGVVLYAALCGLNPQCWPLALDSWCFAVAVAGPATTVGVLASRFRSQKGKEAAAFVISRSFVKRAMVIVTVSALGWLLKGAIAPLMIHPLSLEIMPTGDFWVVVGTLAALRAVPLYTSAMFFLWILPPPRELAHATAESE